MNTKPSLILSRGEIWTASLDPRKGTEVGKQRPVLIIQTDLLNHINHPTAIICPISSQVQQTNILRYKIENQNLSKRFGFVLIDQIRTIDISQRLKRRIGKIGSKDLSEIDQLIIQVLDL